MDLNMALSLTVDLNQ